MSAQPDEYQDQREPTPPQSLPPRIGYGHPEFHFIQAIIEMQKSLGEIKSSIDTLNKNMDSTRNKVDDLVKWKHMIVGGAITIGFLIGITFALVKLI